MMRAARDTTSMTLADMCRRFSLDLPKEADPERAFMAVASLDAATGRDVAFCDDARYLAALRSTQAGAVLVSDAFAEDVPSTAVALVCSRPRLVYSLLVKHLSDVGWSYDLPGIHPQSSVHPSATVHATARIGPFAVIDADAVLGPYVVVGASCVLGRGVVVGDHTQLHPRVTLYQGVQLGKRCTIQSGAVIGSDGFGNVRADDGWYGIAHVGGVVLHDDVDVGANTVIDAGTMKPTEIHKGVKLDNHIQVAHNVVIGEHTAIAGCVGIAGSTRIGSWCMIGGGCMITGHITITDEVIITGDSSVTRSIHTPGTYSGGGVIQNNRAWRKSMVRLTQLDQLNRRVSALEKTCE